MAPWTTADIPDQRGRTAVVTGANTGLGQCTAAALAAAGATVVLAVRDLDKGKTAAAGITAEHPGAHVVLQELDLASLESVRAAAADIAAAHDSVDLLINNAGVMFTPRSTTADGFELQFGTNHLGHFAFTGLLADRLLATPGSRVVTVSSVGHRFANRIDLDDVRAEGDYNRYTAYGRAKLANLLFTYELARRLSGTTTSALAAHPGGSRTELGRNLPRVLQPINAFLSYTLLQGPEMGALPTLRAATDPGALSGQYFGPDGFAEQRGHPVVVASTRASHDVDAQRRLWARSEELTGVTFPV